MNTKNPFVTRTKLIGNVDMGKVNTTISMAGDRIVFDIERKGKVASLAMSRRVTSEGPKGKNMMSDLGYNVNAYTYEYEIFTSTEGTRGPTMTVKSELESNNSDVDLKKGIPSREFEGIIDGLEKFEAYDVAKLVKLCVPTAEDMRTKLNADTQKYGAKLNDFMRDI